MPPRQTTSDASSRRGTRLSDGEVLARLALATAGTIVLAYFVYAWADRQARWKGFIDMDAAQ